jgi:hypothetical protein
MLVAGRLEEIDESFMQEEYTYCLSLCWMLFNTRELVAIPYMTC